MNRSILHQSPSKRRCECTSTRTNNDATRFLRSIALFQMISDPSRFIHAASPPSAFVVSSSPPSTRHHRSQSHVALSSSRPPLVDAPFSLPFGQDKIERYTKSNVLVQIERTSRNERRISGEMILTDHAAMPHFDVALEEGTTWDEKENDRRASAVGLDDVWTILTDYDHLSMHVPNLVESRIIPPHGGGSSSPTRRHHQHSSGTTIVTTHGPRVYQKGSQRIWGFEFGADVTLDMKESIIDYTYSHDMKLDPSSGFMLPTTTKKYILDFKCVNSQFFSIFDGSWIVEECVTGHTADHPHREGGTTTTVKYVVDVRPKGPVPVAALEWRIKEDVPTNMLGVANAAARMARRRQENKEEENVSIKNTSLRGNHPSASASSDFRGERLGTNHNPIIHARNGVGMDWYKDETMAMYL
ncbi:hypothetical protein HJC23_001902 [Cyclotella cryptica]|uniref:Coenzyme Q-binding protein COQ10 START domain-containing protein n=1 Tax=Cyclotella cryptica TaxID=29204 RepID=A0ABD3NY68_9STRA|eukprot:CCRYP_019005-RA/>CCRYP_019005-RA protein AED:0.15 eAED:0.29 QI:0/-1/0/1/-1/1/1/0/413